jgi:hypothetical protein
MKLHLVTIKYGKIVVVKPGAFYYWVVWFYGWYDLLYRWRSALVGIVKGPRRLLALTVSIVIETSGSAGIITKLRY